MSFSDNVWWTRKARIQAEKRLLDNDFHAQVILLWYSFVAVAASVYAVKFSSANSDSAGIAWIIYSVLALCMSGFINGLSFKQRASLIKECYETLNNIFQRAKRVEENDQLKSTSKDDLTAEYEQILGVCENHLTIDYYIALCEAYLTQPTSPDENCLNRIPTAFIWCSVAWGLLKRWILRLAFYVLPIALFYGLEHLV